MAELLGNKYSVENLQKDVDDLHKVISNLTSRLGQVSYSSWKYPDKLAIDLNIPELLEMCEFDAAYDEENQISHLLLLELVIDRLLFFVQCSSRFMDQIPLTGRAQSAIDSNSSSIGIATKKYWTKLLQLHSSYQQLQSDAKFQSTKIKELQAFNEELQNELSQYHQGVTQIPTDSAHGTRSRNGSILPPISQTGTNTSIAKDNSNKSSQTLETAFVPCESCHKVQNCFRSVADSMTQVCKVQGIPSAIAKFRKQLKGIDWYSANDIARWSVEQEKDLERINKHLSDLMATIDPLKEELASAITSCRNLEERVTECLHEVDVEKQKQLKADEKHTNTMSAVTKKHEEVKHQLESESLKLRITKQQLEQKLQETKRDLELQISKFEELSDVKQQLMAELEEAKTNNSEVLRLETILSSLEKEMLQTKEKLLETEAQLQQEQSITRSLNKRTESLQSKYDSLVQRIEEMDEENCSLQTDLSSLIEEKEQLENSLAGALKHKKTESVVAKIESEKKELQNCVSSLTKTIENLEKELDSMKERETLMVEYPDLNGPVNSDITGSGDIFSDMANQVRANQIRIELLQQQNTGLEKTLKKMKPSHNISSNAATYAEEVASHRVETPSRHGRTGEVSESHFNSVSPMEPTPLWNLGNGSSSYNSYKKERDFNSTSDANHENVKGSKSGVTHTGKGDWTFTVGRNPEQPARQVSSKMESNSGVDAYMKLKKAGLLKSKGRQARNDQGEKAAHTSQSYCCPKCDKLYHSLADLEIHKSYCSCR